MILRPTQKVDVFEHLRMAGAHPADFECHDFVSACRVEHRTSGFFFTFGLNGSEWQLTYSPDRESMLGEFTATSWASAVRRVYEWALWVKEDLAAPDVWGEIARAPLEVLEGPRLTESDVAFTPEETQRISEKLDEIEQYVLAIANCTSDDAAFKTYVRQRLTYLEEATRRVGRKDWLAIAASTLLSIFASSFVPAEQIQEGMRFAWQQIEQALVPLIRAN